MNKRILLCMCMLAILLTAGPSSASSLQSRSEEIKLDRALKLFTEGDYRQAMVEFSKLNNLSEKSAEQVSYYNALCAAYLKDENAVKLMEVYLEEYPASIRKQNAYLSIGDMLFETEDFRGALQWYEKADKFSIRNPQAKERFLYNLASCQFATGKLTDAKVNYHQLLESDKYSMDATYRYAHIAYTEGNYDMAIKYFDKVEKTAPYDKLVPYYKTNILFYQKDFKGAIASGEAVIAQNPADKSHNATAIKKVVGDSYFNLEAYDKALPYLNEAFERTARPDAQEYYHLGYCHYKAGAYEKAVESLSKATGGNNATDQAAWYVLGDCALKQGRKTDALSCFKAASEKDFNPVVSEDALYNYALLTYETDPSHTSAEVILQKFIGKYPQSIKAQQAREYLYDCLLSSKKYAQIIDAVSQQGEPSYAEKVFLQKAAFFRGTEELNADRPGEAEKYFQMSLEGGFDATFRARAKFWLAELYMRDGQYEKATAALDEFRASPSAPQCKEYTRLNYQLAFLAIRQGHHQEALTLLEAYRKAGNLTKEEQAAVCLLEGDSHFSLRGWNEALKSYNQALLLGTPRADYTLYQKSICLSLTSQGAEQVKVLTQILASYPNSTYRAAVRYDMGVAFQRMGDNTKAIQNLLAVEKEKADDELLARSKSRAALIYYEMNQPEKALAMYQEVITKYPGSPETATALKNARNIFIEQGKTEEFIRWSRDVAKVEISDSQADSLKYQSGEILFMKEQYAQAAEAFRAYLAQYPSGVFAVNANYYTAQANLKTGDKARALIYLENVVKAPVNPFTEGSLVQGIDIYLDDKDNAHALIWLEKLDSAAQNPQNKKYAAATLMRLYDAEEAFASAVKYARKVGELYKDDQTLYPQALTLEYVNRIMEGDYSDAEKGYERIKGSLKGENAAKALYYKALAQYNTKAYDKSVESISTLASDHSAYQWWGAKGLVLMAQDYQAKGDLYQANYILDNVITNFNFEDIKAEAEAVKTFINRK